MRPVDNRQVLEHLLRQGAVRCRKSRLLNESPPNLVRADTWDRAEGMMIGLAVGDSLGNTTESLLPGQRYALHGEIRDYLPHRRGVPGESPSRGYPSDDTQLAYWTLEQLLEDQALAPANLARRFTRQHIYGIGSSVRTFVSRHKDQGLPWHGAGVASAGNGALMRIFPVILPWISNPSSDLWVDAVLCSMITHNDSASIASCVAMVCMAWSLMGMEAAPEPTWWLETFLSVARQVEDETAYEARSPRFSTFSGKLSDFVEERIQTAWRRGLSAREACDEWYSGAYLLETVPSVLYILMRHGNDPEEAVVRAVNDTKDNDSIAAITGALVGALHGGSGLPARWVAGLSGRTGERDDGQVFELLGRARRTWYDASASENGGSAPRFGMVTPEGIARVLAFLPALEGPMEALGRWRGGAAEPEDAESAGEVPCVEWSQTVLDFVQCLYGERFIVPFPWQEWREVHEYTRDSRLLAQADLETIQKLLTTHVRADRFAEGNLYDVIQSGLMAAILRRLAVLARGGQAIGT